MCRAQGWDVRKRQILTCGCLVQVYTAEEKAALAMVNFEENKRKEEKILGDMRTLVQRSVGTEEDAEETVPVKQWNTIM